MTVKKTIALARSHAAAGNVPAACRILDGAKRAALSNKSQWAYAIAKTAILDAAVDATVARSQVAS